MSALLRLPHGLMRRYLSLLERTLVAAGLSALLYGLMRSLPVYPPNWDLVIVAAVFVVALWSPTVAYFLAVAAAAYPLFSLSLYVAVLFLALALLGQRVFIYNLGALVLVLAVPWLARYNLAWIVPVLGGLWWGASGGAWMGGMAALWGQLVAGMSGLNPDWLALSGSYATIDGIAQRFGQANSLETLKLILEPLAPNTTLLLYHLLQIIVWAAVGAVVGAASDRTWVQKRRPWGTILAGATGVVVLLGAHLGLGLWLEQYTRETLSSRLLFFVATAVVTVVVVGSLEGLRDFVEHPLPPYRRLARPRRRARGAPDPGPTPLPVPSQLPDWEPADEAQDLIMLELD